MFTLGTIAEAK